MSDVLTSCARPTKSEARDIAEALTAVGYGVWRRLFANRGALRTFRARFLPAPLLACAVAAITLLPAVADGHPRHASRSYPNHHHTPQTNAPVEAAAPETNEPGGKHKGRLLTPDQVGHDKFVTGVAEAPLHDIDVMNAKIPPVLKRAMADPYERPKPYTCREITAQVRGLYEALGPDYDEATSKEHNGLVSKDSALDAMREGEKAFIPFDGFIRFVSGAERHDRYVLAAIQAGATRRAYLKGLGEAHGCDLPGAPDHFVRASTERKEPGFGPYPKQNVASR
jgi:hypothetical protein